MSVFTKIGQPTKLIDGGGKVTGNLKFVTDLKLPGMLIARIVPSMYAHANILGIDKSQALAVPGVVDVITADDLPKITPKSRTRLMLARDRVIFVGQPVAIILADSETAAADGLEQLQIDYEPLPVASTIQEAMAENAPLVWTNGIPTGAEDEAAHGAATGADTKEEDTKISNVSGPQIQTRGDIEVGFAEADVIVERVFTSPYVHQNSIETHGVIVQPEPVSNSMTIWSSTQDPFGVRKEVADVLNISETDIRVIGTPVGGAFGAKFGLYEPLVATVAHVVGRPVQLILTRSEELHATNPAPGIQIRLKVGAQNDGTLTAIDCEVHIDSGCYPTWLANFLPFVIASFYPVDHFRLSGTNVLTFKQSTGAYRAPGAPTATFAIDTILDEIASKIGMDTFDIRLKNCAVPGAMMANDKEWQSMGMSQVLERLREHPIWQNREEIRAKGHGIGVSVGGWFGGTEPAAAVCKLNRDGLLQVNVGSADISGVTTGFAVLAAEVFGVDSDQIRVTVDDTVSAPYSGGSGGSKVTYSTGNAVVAAVQDAKRQVLEIAAEEFEANPDDLEIVEGEIRVKGLPSKSLKLGEIANKTMQFGGGYKPIHGNGRTAVTAQSPGFCAQLAEVEVDKETGDIKLHNLIVVQDVGRALNPLAVKGQMVGGAVQGIGWALYEKMDYDNNGQLLSGSWMDYALPHSIQVADNIEAIIVEVPSDHGPFGARGVGEPPVIPTIAAVANAVADATGVRITNIPMTAPRVLKALNSHNGNH